VCLYVTLQDTEKEINLRSKRSETSLVVHAIKSTTKEGGGGGDSTQMTVQN
jgi:hypothetical protein